MNIFPSCKSFWAVLFKRPSTIAWLANFHSKPPTQTEKQKKTQIQKDRKTERQKDRKTERQKDRKTERQKDRQTERQKDWKIVFYKNLAFLFFQINIFFFGILWSQVKQSNVIEADKMLEEKKQLMLELTFSMQRQ